MLDLPDYQAHDELHRSTNSVVYRGQRRSDQQPVILKVLNKSYPTPMELMRFRREYEIAYQLQGPGIIQVLGLEPYQHSLLMIMEDIKGLSLRQVMREQTLSLEEKLTIALQIVDGLTRVHEQGVMHKDLNPTNILLSPLTNQVKLIDFGLATRLAREEALLQQTDALEGTLPYISPEQTGRMNRVVDYRTDFYSFGVLLYELLTGQRPFESADPLEVVHGHIARQPLPPHDLNPEIPPVLSAIVLKLLAKTARLRYQSAYGIKADLAEVLRQLQETRWVVLFRLGQKDFSTRFQLPQTLYGREAELATLLSVFDRVSQVSTELLLVKGYAGIGKTALVNELHKPLVGRRGYFISGKFDQLQRNIPYTALIQAFRDLIRQLLTESKARVARWRERLLAVLGSSGQVIIDVIPEAELLIGPQPTVPELGLQASQNRFRFIFQNFIGVFTQEEHPLVLFLDDLQWADSASLNLLHLFLADPERQHLMALGAYRDNEVNGTHPLSLMLNEFEKEGVDVQTVVLSPLRLEHVSRLVADSLHDAPERSHPLAETVYRKTAGNPFFVGEFLKALYQEDLLYFVQPRARSDEVGWRWDLAQIEARDITDNVVDLMKDKMHQLPQATQEALRLAACLGNHFALTSLAQVQEQPPGAVAAALWPALDAGLLLPVGEGYRLLQPDSEAVEGLAETLQISYKFLHDRVQEAAYALIPESDRAATHLHIGHLFLVAWDAEEQEQHLFEIVDHLNEGRALINEADERERLSQLNLRVGQKSKEAMAYGLALQYLTTGLELLPPERWQSHYSLTLALYQAAAESAYLQRDFNQLEVLIAAGLAHATTLLDKIKFYDPKINADIAQYKMGEAWKQINQVLGLLGFALPDSSDHLDVLVAERRAEIARDLQCPTELLSLPKAQDPHAIAAMALLGLAIPPVYFVKPELFPLLACQMVWISVRYGNTPTSPLGYVSYALFLCAIGEIQIGYEFGTLAVKLLERFPTRQYEGSTNFLVDGLVRHWKEPLRLFPGYFRRDYQLNAEVGDIGYAGFSLSHIGDTMFFAGYPLPLVAAEMAECTALLNRIQQQVALPLLQICHQTVSNLLGESPDPLRLTGEHLDEEQALPRFAVAGDQTNFALAYICKAMLAYHFGEYPQALGAVLSAERCIQGLVSHYSLPPFYFYYSLSLLACGEQARGKERKRYLEQVKANQAILHTWAQHNPINVQHKYELVEAERARLQKKHTRAMNCYQRAIELAHEHGYLQEEALANELAGRYYLERGMAHVAQGYMRDARQGYLLWGAQAKVRWLDRRYKALLRSASEAETASLGTPSPSLSSTSTRTSSSMGMQLLDLATVIKASQAISSEIELDRLLARLLHSVMENAGAQKGVLLLLREGHLYIEAESMVEPPSMQVLQGCPIEESLSVPPGIIHYVERTRDAVVLDDASQEGLFTHDPYIQRTQPGSVLAAPLLSQGQLVGVLYLENNLSAGAFTPARVEMVRLLGTQAVISISNAQTVLNLIKGS